MKHSTYAFCHGESEAVRTSSIAIAFLDQRQRLHERFFALAAQIRRGRTLWD
jgi:hypothetical protein